MIYHRQFFSKNIMKTIKLSTVKVRLLFRLSSMLAFKKNIRVLIKLMISCLRLIVKVLILKNYIRINNSLISLISMNKVKDQK